MGVVWRPLDFWLAFLFLVGFFGKIVEHTLNKSKLVYHIQQSVHTLHLLNRESLALLELLVSGGLWVFQ